MQKQNREINVLTIKSIKDNTYKVEVDEAWFFAGEALTSNNLESFKVKKEYVEDETGDWYTMESQNEIKPANLKNIKTLRLKG